MWWMWILGPFLVALIWFTTGWRDRRREGEIERWRRTMGAKRVVAKEAEGYRTAKQIVATKAGPGPKVVNALPGRSSA